MGNEQSIPSVITQSVIWPSLKSHTRHYIDMCRQNYIQGMIHDCLFYNANHLIEQKKQGKPTILKLQFTGNSCCDALQKTLRRTPIINGHLLSYTNDSESFEPNTCGVFVHIKDSPQSSS